MEKYKAEGTDSSNSVMWFINLSPALSFCSGWRCTEDWCCSALHTLQGRRWICIHWGTGSSAWERQRVLSAPHALLRISQTPVPSAHSLENPGGRPSCSSSPLSLQQQQHPGSCPGSSHSWGHAGVGWTQWHQRVTFSLSRECLCGKDPLHHHYVLFSLCPLWQKPSF